MLRVLAHAAPARDAMGTMQGEAAALRSMGTYFTQESWRIPPGRGLAAASPDLTPLHEIVVQMDPGVLEAPGGGEVLAALQSRVDGAQCCDLESWGLRSCFRLCSPIHTLRAPGWFHVS